MARTQVARKSIVSSRLTRAHKSLQNTPEPSVQTSPRRSLITKSARKPFIEKQKSQSGRQTINKRKISVRRTNVEREISRLQRSAGLLVPRAPILRIIKSIMQNINPELRIQSLAVEALREAVETYCVTLFEDANLCAMHSKRATVMVRDLQLVRRLRGEHINLRT